MAHRDFGKTSLLLLGYAAKRLLFNETRTLVPLSCSETHAVMQSESLKYEFTENETIQGLWGEIRPSKYESKQAKEAWTVRLQDAKEDTLIVPRGAGQQLRGLLFRDWRPDLILIDDLEDPAKEESEGSREKLKSWFFSTLENLTDFGSDGWEVIMMGTAVHHDSLIWEVIDDTEHWEVVNVPLCDDNFKTYWPSRFPQSAVDEKIAYMKKHHRLDEFFREFMNKKTAGEHATFRDSDFHYYDPEVIDVYDRSRFENILIIDPAKTVSSTSADTGFVVVSFDLKHNNKYRIPIAYGERLHVNDIVQKAFELYLMYNCTFMAVEETSLNEWIRTPFINYANEHGIPQSVILWLHASVKKEFRVKGLSAPYRSGQIEHHPTACKQLEMQLVAFPMSDRWDVMDAAAYLLKIIDDYYMHFAFYDPFRDDEDEATYEMLNDDDDTLEDDELDDSWSLYDHEDNIESGYNSPTPTHKKDNRWVPQGTYTEIR